VLAILGGVAAAILWSVANVGSTRASREIGTASTVGVATSVGLLITIPGVLAAPIPALTGPDLAALGIAGFGGVVGLGFAYRALRIGKIGIVSALISTEGAIAATLAVLAGEVLRPVVGLILGVIAVGVVVLAVSGGGAAESHRTRRLDPADARAAVLNGLAAAILFGAGLFAAGQLAGNLSPVYAALPSRVGGFAFVLLPLLARRQLRVTRDGLRWALIVGLADVVGILAFGMGARDNTAVAAVLASQVAAVSTLAAFLFYHEHLSRRQVVGLVVVAIGVAALAVARG
jgi:drug/metabolite transporter (DMT)-like permease